jgi:4-hydroxybenzoate polyprenyltransferase
MTSRSRRIATYLSRMFPLWQMAPISVIHFLAAYWTLQAGGGHVPVRIGFRAIGGTITVFLFSLLLRVYDEIKDFESDLLLAESGDPWYRDRPVVTGTVKRDDILRLRSLLEVSLVAANLLMFDAIILSASAVLLGLAWLSSKWFFFPRMRNNLPLALLTHNPLALASEMYIAAIAFAGGLLGKPEWWVGLLLVGLWLPVTAWETARKIRLPEDETAYQTYSKLFGPRVAGLAPLLFTALSVACLIPVVLKAQLGLPCAAAIAIAGMISMGSCLLFVIAPSRSRARLRPVATLYVVTINTALAVSACLNHGVAF